MRITPHRHCRSLASRAAGAVIESSGGLGAHGFRKRAAHEESSCTGDWNEQRRRALPVRWQPPRTQKHTHNTPDARALGTSVTRKKAS